MSFVRPRIDSPTLGGKVEQIERYLYQLVDYLEMARKEKTIRDMKVEGGHLFVRYTDADKYIDLGAVKGDNGKTPVKGVDYYTEADKAEIVAEITASISI